MIYLALQLSLDCLELKFAVRLDPALQSPKFVPPSQRSTVGLCSGSAFTSSLSPCEFELQIYIIIEKVLGFIIQFFGWTKKPMDISCRWADSSCTMKD